MATGTSKDMLDLSVYDILQQVTASVRNWAPDLRMSVEHADHDQTWTSILAAVSQVLQPVDRRLVIFPPFKKKTRQELLNAGLIDYFDPSMRELAEAVERGQGGPRAPIQTSFPSRGEPPKATPQIKEGLRKLA